jgi:hypothetical protein
VLVGSDLLQLTSYQGLSVTAHCPYFITNEALESKDPINNGHMLYHPKRNLRLARVKPLLVFIKALV